MTREYTDQNCLHYIDATAGRDTPGMVARGIAHALAAFPTGERTALELGCGAGNDALTMLKQGFAVTVVDLHARAIDTAIALAERHNLASNLTTHISPFEHWTPSPAGYCLINARFCLPFCLPRHFPGAWRMIRSALRPGGIFAGQLFGPNDEWANDPEREQINAHSREDVRKLLTGFTIHKLLEVDRIAHTATGKTKHWHGFNIIAQRPAPGPRK